MADAVKYTGGWLYDQVMAGWEVVVLVPGDEDVRPLDILGATTLDLESALSSPYGPVPQTVVVSAEIYERDTRIRAGLLEALDQGLTKVTFWDEELPTELDMKFGSTKHHLSRAAQVFKAHALAAASQPRESAGATETFRVGGVSAGSSKRNLVAMN
ncbi:hypothetical protein [Rhodococcus chondri]|uniref:hypothetical protein n=1 Tax=Rhodococcus chondri TaxID=3065941 RepID=UPI002E7ABC10|nr:hypothetical protein [Rhodococcus sp. CC-R104]